jgi:hypothetical protein
LTFKSETVVLTFKSETVVLTFKSETVVLTFKSETVSWKGKCVVIWERGGPEDVYIPMQKMRG